MTWTLVEPCCGVAELATHLTKAYKRPILPYQGSKWKVRKTIHEILKSYGFTTPPNRVVLVDIGPWGDVWRTLLEHKTRTRTVDILEALAKKDPHEVYKSLHRNETSKHKPLYAAEYLFLQRLTFGGKAVSDVGGVWRSPGFNKTDAYGRPATKAFGKINPGLPVLIRALKEFNWAATLSWDARRGDASDVMCEDDNVVVYIDPPYQGTTPYPNGTLNRSAVINLANNWSGSGATVIVSEAEPIMELAWHTTHLMGPQSTTALVRGRVNEWATHKGPK